MTVLDVSIVNVALPSIGRSLDFSQENLQWVITAYAITFGGFLLLGGRAADLLGRRRVFLTGVAVFTIASFLCGFAWSENVLIAARLRGPRCRDHRRRALDHHHDVRRAVLRATRRSASRRDQRLRRRRRHARGWCADEVPRLGVIFFVNVPVGIAASCSRRAVREPLGSQSSFDAAVRSRSPQASPCSVYAISKAPDHGWTSAWTISRIAASQSCSRSSS
jgi:hypothetical protein